MALTRPITAHAGTDGDVVLGGSNSETTGTTIDNSTSGATAFKAEASGTGAGVVGGSASGWGVYGICTSGEGVYARSGSFDSGSTPSRNGVHGVTDSSADSAVWGENIGSPGGNGVYGSTSSSGASGVYGHNAGSGYGVAGRAEGGTGILGDTQSGIGVWANSTSGTSLKATTTGGTALNVTGRTKFNRSGVASIAYPALSAAVTVPGGLMASALVFAVMQNALAGVWVVSAVPNTSTGKAMITLNKAPGTSSAPKTAKVAWFVVN